MYIDGALLVDDDGLHGMLERCATRFMTAGLHSVYVTGFQAWGGVGMEIRYSGPDTGDVMTFMRVSPLPEPPAPSSAGAAAAPPAAGPPSAAVSAPAVVLHGSDKSTQMNSELVIGKVRPQRFLIFTGSFSILRLIIADMKPSINSFILGVLLWWLGVWGERSMESSSRGRIKWRALTELNTELVKIRFVCTHIPVHGWFVPTLWFHKDVGCHEIDRAFKRSCNGIA
jgi:hypothetical protein